MKKKQNILILILLLITIAAVGVTLWALFLRNTDEQPMLTPNVAPEAEEQYAETIPDDSDEKMEEPEGGSSVSISYGREVAVSLNDATASLIFANPGRSNQDMVLQIIVQETVIAQSGTIKPGNQISQMDLLDGMVDKLSAGTYEGNFNVLFYDPETGTKAMVNTMIPIEITGGE